MCYFKKYLPVSTVLVFLLAATAWAQDPKSSVAPPPAASLTAKPGDSADKVVENFFALLTKDQVDQAYDYLTNGTKIAEKPEEVVNLKAKTRDAIKIFGEIQGYELIDVKNVGTHLMCSTYISLGKGFPLHWKFYFYRRDKTWRLIDIRVDDRLMDMFEEKNPPLQSGAGQ